MDLRSWDLVSSEAGAGIVMNSPGILDDTQTALGNHNRPDSMSDFCAARAQHASAWLVKTNLLTPTADNFINKANGFC
jgi:hypothetical protein